VDRNGLSRGTYTQTIAIASNGGSETVKVTMSVQEGLSIDVSPESLDFGTTTTTLELTLTNPASTSSTVAYTLTPSNNWIRVSKVQGQFVGTEKITVSVDRSQLSEGSYTGSLALTVEGRTISIPVKMAVASQAKPTVNLNGLLETSYNTATVQGAVVSVGSSRVTHYGFVWSTAEQPTVENGKKCDLGDTQTPKDFTYQITNLEASTYYYVRVYAENGEGISYSAQLRFTTLKAPSTPLVETGEATKIQAFQAEVSGNLTDLGVEAGVTSYGHVWSTQPTPTISDDKTDLGASARKGTFKSTLTGLEPNTLYYVRAYARNQYGISYGKDVQFTTDCGDVTLTTKAVSAITYSTAASGGIITVLQGNTITERGVCWNTQSGPVRTQSHATSKEQTEDFTVQMTGLSENTSYYVRAYVITGKGATFYGPEVQFQTPYEVKVPSLSAVTASNVTYKSASFAATVTSDGHGTLTDAGFVYSTSHNPTVNDSKLSCGTKTSLTANVSTLNPETTYYVRAYATNANGTAYGEETSFTTRPDMVSRGLLAYYTFDNETADNAWSDDYHGFLNGGSFIADTPNGEGRALSLQSQQFVNIGYNPLSDCASWSVSMWLKDFGAGTVFAAITGVVNNYGCPAFGFNEDGIMIVSKRNSYSFLTMSTSWTSYQHSGWIHIVATGSGKSFTVYLNGRRIDTTTYSSGFTGFGNSMTIGGKATGGTSTASQILNKWANPMKIDNVRIYNVALTDDEVKQVYDYER